MLINGRSLQNSSLQETQSSKESESQIIDVKHVSFWITPYPHACWNFATPQVQLQISLDLVGVVQVSFHPGFMMGPPNLIWTIRRIRGKSFLRGDFC